MFEATPVNLRNQNVERLVRALFGLMTLLLVLPVAIILGIKSVVSELRIGGSPDDNELTASLIVFGVGVVHLLDGLLQ